MRHHLQAAQRDGAPDVTRRCLRPMGGLLGFPPGPRDVQDLTSLCSSCAAPSRAGVLEGAGLARGADGGGPHSIGRLVLTSPRAVRAAVIGCSLQE